MRIIGVLDLLRGRAVHARAGRREHYEPVRAVHGLTLQPGDAHALARWYVEQLHLEEIYVADLDALMGGSPQDSQIAALATIGAPLVVDAGVTSVDRAHRVLAAGADRVIVALETLERYEALAAVCAAVGGERVAFSLDLRNGEPIRAPGADAAGICAGPPDRIAARACDAGAGSVIVIDVARVGTDRGLDLELLARVREATPGLTLLAGGGVRDAGDLVQLAGVGCEGALVASALHDGRLGAAEIAAARAQDSFSR